MLVRHRADDDAGTKVGTLSVGPPSAPPPAIVIDVGHSTSKPGAVAASGTTEFIYNKQMAYRISTWLTRSGVSSRMIGYDGRSDDLMPRARAAAGGRMLLSIHHDSVQASLLSDAERYSGFSLYVSARNPHYAAGVRCARIIGAALVKAGHHPALFHADAIPGEGYPLLDPSIGLYRRDGLAVISRAPIAAVLLEVGVIANPTEERWLARPEVADAIAGVVAKAVSSCSS